LLLPESLLPPFLYLLQSKSLICLESIAVCSTSSRTKP
jgi:hypothetical protein